MKLTDPSLQIRIHGVDGSVQTFTQDDPIQKNHTLKELNPTTLFNQDRFTLTVEDSEIEYFSDLIARIDLITDRLSVWDFPFVIGAFEELTEEEFLECHQHMPGPDEAPPKGDTRMIFDLDMVGGGHTFLCTQIIAGLPRARLRRIHSVLRAPRLIFGLRTRGVGILNVSNMARFLVEPEPPEETAVARPVHYELVNRARA